MKLMKRPSCQGVVLVHIVINESGDLSDASIVRSVPLLDDAAFPIVRTWRFEPTIVNGQPVSVQATVPVNFTLPSSNR